MSSGAVKLQGAANFRHRLAFSLLSGRSLTIENIRDREETPGLTEYEASFLRVIDKITNGTRIDINETGTRLRVVPGVLVGGSFTHDCGLERGIGYFVEALLLLAPFGKKPLRMALTGLTNAELDVGVDTLRAVTLPTLRHLGLQEGLSLQIKRRGVAPRGGGLVLFTCPVVRELKPMQVTFEGFVKRIRGVAFATKVSPQLANRCVESSRGLLNKFLPDVFVATDHVTGRESGNSPGYGLSLVAESTAGCAYGVEGIAGKGESPEELGERVSRLLFDEIARGGSVDTLAVPLVLSLMALTPEDVSRVRIGKLSSQSVEVLRLLKDFFGIVFKLSPEPRGSVRRKRPAMVEAAAAPAAKRSRNSGKGASVEPGVGVTELDEEAKAALGAGVREDGFVKDAHHVEVAQTDTVLVSCLGLGYKNLAKKVT